MPLPPDVDFRCRVGEAPRLLIEARSTDPAAVSAVCLGPDDDAEDHPIGSLRFEPGSAGNAKQLPSPDQWSVMPVAFTDPGRYRILIDQDGAQTAWTILVRPDNRPAAETAGAWANLVAADDPTADESAEEG